MTRAYIFAHQRCQCAEFCCITDLRAGGMRLDVIDFRQFLYVGICPLDGKDLPFATGSPQASAPPVT